jgi:hypothetical protein
MLRRKLSKIKGTDKRGMARDAVCVGLARRSRNVGVDGGFAINIYYIRDVGDFPAPVDFYLLKTAPLLAIKRETF